jgi:uncharacterized SAM-binding protein YcdF (DUF218 family)
MDRLKYPAILIGVVLLIWCIGYVIFIVRVITADFDKPVQKSDAIIVLTGGSKRIETGVSLLRKGLAGHLLISGVDRHVTRSDVLATHNLPEKLRECCVTLGRQAKDTPGNARETYHWTRDKDIQGLRLVTSNYHIDRARLEFTHQMPDLRIHSHPVRPANFNVMHQHFWRLTFEEYHKLLYRIGFHTLSRLTTDRH